MKQVKDKYTRTTLEQMPQHKLFRALMSGLNDSPRHIRELTRLLNGIKCRINLIRFHRIPDSPYFSPGDEAMVRFRDALTARGIQTTIRASRGEDIQAACGLLSTRLKGGI